VVTPRALLERWAHLERKGPSFDRSFSRGSGSVGFNIRTPFLPPISGSALYGATTADAPVFEQFAIGGGRSPLSGKP
jgi:hypothetical protein